MAGFTNDNNSEQMKKFSPAWKLSYLKITFNPSENEEMCASQTGLIDIRGKDKSWKHYSFLESQIYIGRKI